MIVFNLWNIKRTNGLYYYALDYLWAVSARGVNVTVWARHDLHIDAKLIPTTVNIQRYTFWQFVKQCVVAARSGIYVYTPTPHPLPFMRRQLVVLHDLYPFTGDLGCLKRWLFLLSARISRCRLAYINHSDVYRFYLDKGFPDDQLIYAPNAYPVVSGTLDKSQLLSGTTDGRRLRIGLVGTDSPKKNYNRLLSSMINAAGDVGKLPAFIIYGHQTSYIQSVQAAFPAVELTLIASDEVDMVGFFSQVDVLVSVAEGEGFGRPIATALALGVPCFLLDVPVFREFFDGGASFYSSVDELAMALQHFSVNDMVNPIEFSPPASAQCAFDGVVQYLIRNSS